MPERDEKNGNDQAREKNSRFARMIEDAIAISDRFAREPVFGPTGKGHYKSAGVEGLRQDIERLKLNEQSGHAE